MEGELERCEDAEYLERRGWLTTSALQRLLIQLHRRKDIVKEPEFYIPKDEKRPRKLRWRIPESRGAAAGDASAMEPA